ncbi:hypothetical protein HDK90DRAFT_469468 [Phyllosticta capitalensis]|uniref:Uncharacterized protein n=1 Tax=Phyllosticta capitalensis TaxID=121624 RepID=A0ABR1YC44_9PEZI
MGNEQSSPAAAKGANDNSKDSQVTGPHEPAQELTQTDRHAPEITNDDLPTLATFDETPPDLISPTAPIGIPPDARDKRPAFLRRLTTAPSVLTATHAENVTATPTSPSPEKTLKNGAKEQLNTVTTRSRSATNPSIQTEATAQPLDDKEALSSLEHTRSGSVSPLSFAGEQHKELDEHGRPVSPCFAVEQPDDAPHAASFSDNGLVSPCFGEQPDDAPLDQRPASFSVDDWAWRMEFAPSEASDDDDIDPEFFPLPDGDDESFADDELSYLDPGRESALRGESRNEDYCELARVSTNSSAESTQKAASLHDEFPRDTETDAMRFDNPSIADTQCDEEQEPEEQILAAALPLSDSPLLQAQTTDETDMDGSSDTQEMDAQADVRCEVASVEKPSAEEPDQVEHLEAAQPLQKSPLQADVPEDVDNRRDSAMYQLFEPKDMEQLQTIKEPEPADRRKSMSLASIEDITSELSVAGLQGEASNQGGDDEDSFVGTSTVHTSILDQADDKEAENVERSADDRKFDQAGNVSIESKQEAEPAGDEIPKETDKVIESQSADDKSTNEDIPEVEQLEKLEKLASEPVEEAEITKDEEKPQEHPIEPALDSKRPATAHPSQTPVETTSRPLTAPSTSVLPAREKNKSWRKTWPNLGSRAKGKEPVQDPDEILPVPASSDAQEMQPAPRKSEGPTLVSKIPTPADKTAKKKKRGSIIGSIFRHTKEEKPVKESKPKKNSKIAKVYRRSSKRQDKEEQEAPKSSGSATAIVAEPEALKGISIDDVRIPSEGVLKDDGQRSAAKYALPSASLGIPTLLQSPKKPSQDQHWYQRSDKLRRGSTGIVEAHKRTSSLPQAPSRRASIQEQQDPSQRHSIAHPPQAQPILPPPDDSRTNTGIPQPSKIFSYPNRNPPYRGIARTNSSPIQGMSSASPRVVSRIPSPSLSQGPAGRRVPGPRIVDIRRSNTFSPRSGSMSPQTVPEEPEATGLAISSPAAEFVAELADTDVGRRGSESEECKMRATSYPGMEWVPAVQD